MKSIIEQLDAIFKPQSIAVIGASNTPGKWGYQMVTRPLFTGFRGTIYPVNNSEKVVMGLVSYPSVLDIPQPVDLAVVVVPAPVVPRVIAECVQKGVKGAVIITAGFAETGPEGRALQEQVVAIARKGGIRLVGPNCNGLLNAKVGLNLSFEQAPRAGHIAFISQSGTFGADLAESAIAKGYGLSKFVSIGNQADLNAADYLEYFMEDADTKAIILYMEGFREGKRFFQLARESVRKKPVIIYKSGRTEAGARATQSHTGSMAGQSHLFDAMCRQAGILRADEVFQPFDMAEALVHQPLPPGRRIAIVGSGGQGVVTCDACNLLGLEVPEFDRETQAQLKKSLAAHAPTPRNPLDFAGGTRTAQHEAEILDKIASLPYIDGIITRAPIRFPGNRPAEEMQDCLKACEIVGSIPRRHNKPVILQFWRISTSNIVRQAVVELLRGAGLPGYETPEQCARAMYTLVRYAEIRDELGKS